MEDFWENVVAILIISLLVFGAIFGGVKLINFLYKNVKTHGDFVEDCNLIECRKDCLTYTSYEAQERCWRLCEEEINFFCK